MRASDALAGSAARRLFRAFGLGVALGPGCGSGRGPKGGAADSAPGGVSDSGSDSVSDSVSDSAPAGDSGASGDSGGSSPCLPVEGERVLGPSLGDARVSLSATGWFRTERLCDRWWLVDPEGHPFWSVGVNSATPTGLQDATTGRYPYGEAVAAAYASEADWALATAERLQGWGFNTAGSWSDHGHLGPLLPGAVNLHLSGGDWESGAVADWFDPAWEADVVTAASAGARPDDPLLIGYFIDNETRWGPDWRGLETLLQLYLGLPSTAPGKQAAVALLLERHGDVATLNAALGTTFADEAALLAETGAWDALDPGASPAADTLTADFLTLSADRYFSVTAGAIRAADPNHLILGNREVSVMVRLEVYEAAAPYVDVLSINSYAYLDGVEPLALALSGAPSRADGFLAVHERVDLPILVTEFGFRADDAGLPNSWPPVYPRFPTQTERTAAYVAVTRERQAVPWIVGQHWYMWTDDPPNGRFDGEDNNWGLVSLTDTPYEELTLGAAAVNAEIGAWVEVPR